MVALACTCRTFQDTALDTRWRTVPSLTPLIQCLPSDAWGCVGGNKVLILSLKRPTVLSDWARCKMYAPRIRRLGFGLEDNTVIAAGVLAALQQYPMLPLPNLQIYHGEISSSRGLLAIGPNLRELEIVLRTRDDASGFPGLVDSLKTSSPFLRRMTISPSSALLPKLPKAFGDIFVSLKQLTTLSIINLSLPDNALRTLASSPIICVLKSENTSADFLRCLPDNGPIFPNLEDFSFYTSDLDRSSDLIGRMVPRSLRSIVVEPGRAVAMQECNIHSFFKSLEANCDTNILTSICLVQNFSPADSYPNFEDDDWEYTIDTFEPLLSFRNLHTLELNLILINYLLNNASIGRMASAWPLMQQFKLESEVNIPADVETHITLDGLLLMARYWPQLETLSLSFYAVTSVDEVPLQRLGSCCPLLTVLNVGYSRVSSGKGIVAAFLTDIFPNLVEIRCSFYSEIWEDIDEIVIAMGRARKQERAWAE